MTELKRFKPKKCRVCRGTFEPFRPLQVCCTTGCAIQYATQQRAKAAEKKAKAERKELKQAKERIKSRGDWTREAQAVINKYVRLRDHDKGCVSCDKPASWNGQWHASHYKSVGANSALRFNLWNIHKSCSQCNNWLSGNIAEYRIRIIERIGVDKLDWIERHNRSQSYSIDYLKRLKAIFMKKNKRLEKKLRMR